MSRSPSCGTAPPVHPPLRWRYGLCAVVLAATSAGCTFRHHVVQLPSCGIDPAPVAQHTIELRSLSQTPESPEPPSCPAGRCSAGEPQVALGVARPALCNDYPVTYRVIQPDTVARVRLVDQVTVKPSSP